MGNSNITFAICHLYHSFDANHMKADQSRWQPINLKRMTRSLIDFFSFNLSFITICFTIFDQTIVCSHGLNHRISHEVLGVKWPPSSVLGPLLWFLGPVWIFEKLSSFARVFWAKSRLRGTFFEILRNYSNLLGFFAELMTFFLLIYQFDHRFYINLQLEFS